MAIKGQTLADFIAEFTYSDTTKVAGTIGNVEAVKGVEMKKGKVSATESEDNFDDTGQWTLYMDDL